MPLLLAFVGIFIAIALAIGGWFRPAAQAAAPPVDAAPTYSDQQVADAKKAVCAAYEKVDKASAGAGGQTSNDPTLKFVIAVNTRLASQFSANYLLKTLEKPRLHHPV